MKKNLIHMQIMHNTKLHSKVFVSILHAVNSNSQNVIDVNRLESDREYNVTRNENTDNESNNMVSVNLYDYEYKAFVRNLKKFSLKNILTKLNNGYYVMNIESR